MGTPSEQTQESVNSKGVRGEICVVRSRLSPHGRRGAHTTGGISQSGGGLGACTRGRERRGMTTPARRTAAANTEPKPQQQECGRLHKDKRSSRNKDGGETERFGPEPSGQRTGTANWRPSLPFRARGNQPISKAARKTAGPVQSTTRDEPPAKHSRATGSSKPYARTTNRKW